MLAAASKDMTATPFSSDISGFSDNNYCLLELCSAACIA
jgi:hypothetical protein